jgi:hypothetical protein
MPSEAIESYPDLPNIKSLLIYKGLSLEDADQWEAIVKGRAEALKRRGENNVDICDVCKLIDETLNLPKGELRRLVIINTRDAIESLIDLFRKSA